MGYDLTTNYSLKKPRPFEEDDTWGPLLNANFDTIDTQIKARADAIALKQDADPQLAALAAVAAAADTLPYFTSGTAAAVTSLTAFARTLLAGASAAAMRSTLNAASLAGNTFTGNQLINGYLTVGPVNTTDTYQGISVRTGFDSSTGLSVGYVDFANNLGIADGHVFFEHWTDGSAWFNLGLTPAGSRSVDRRVPAVKIGPQGQIGIGGAAFGSSGQVLTSGGSGAAPSWQSPAAFPSGTKMLFQQTAAPTGWTKDTTHNDKALRVVNGTAGTGGTTAFSSVFTSRTASGTTGDTTAGGTVGGTAINISQMPLHGHTWRGAYFNQGTASSNTFGGFMVNSANGANYGPYTGTPTSTGGQQIGGEGGGQTHDHTFTGTAHNHSFSATLDFAVAYVDLIIAVKD